MRTFSISINRIQSASFIVKAKDIDEAIDKAYDAAYNEDWTDEDAEYETCGVREIKQQIGDSEIFEDTLQKVLKQSK